MLCGVCGVRAVTVNAPKPNGTPSGEVGYPQAAFGAVSVDLKVNADRNVVVHYIVSTKELSLTPYELIKNARTPSSANIKFTGVIEAIRGVETTKTLTGLTQKTPYYAYMVAQNTQDTLYQQVVSEYDFTTYARQDTLEFTSAFENRKVKYLLYRPESLLKDPSLKYPICYFLPGENEVVDDPEDPSINMIRNGTIPEFINKGRNLEMMVMSIQHVAEDWNVEMISEAIDHGNSTYPVDPKRVYLTGISKGAIGCWKYAAAHPEKLAAIVPIGGGGVVEQACQLKDVNIWAFHNKNDGVIPTTTTTNMVGAVKLCPPDREVKQTIFPDAGHDCWRRVYDKNHTDWSKSPGTAKVDIYAWLLSKTK